MYKICLFNKYTNRVKTIGTKKHLTDALNSGFKEMEFFCKSRPNIFIDKGLFTISSNENIEVIALIKKLNSR